LPKHYISSAASAGASLVRDQNLGSKVSSGWSFFQNTLNDPNLSENVKTGASAGWSAFSTATKSVWNAAQGAFFESPSSQNTVARSESDSDVSSGQSFGAGTIAHCESVGTDSLQQKRICKHKTRDCILGQLRSAR
ncbi:unnamed protein product, partial [Albugo candida]